MKTIAALTMLFLPATFVATVFGMAFFDYSDRGLVIPGQFWIYVVVTVPTTLFLFVIWWAWNRVTVSSIRSWLRRHRSGFSGRKALRRLFVELGSLLCGRERSGTPVAVEVYTLEEV